MSEENIDFSKIAAESEILAASVKQAEAEAIERQKKRVLDAAELLKMKETPGGKVLLENIEKVYNEFAFTPEQFLKTVTDPNGNDTSIVDSVLVARLAGAREAVRAIMYMFDAAQSVIDAEAEKNK